MPELLVKTKNAVLVHQEQTILKNINVSISSGSFVYLVGKTGSGKTSFLRSLYGDMSIAQGQMEVCGFDINHLTAAQIPLLRRKIGIVFQNFQLLWDRSVEDNLAFVLLATDWKDPKKIRQRIIEVLESVALAGKEKIMPHRLSGGEQQRLSIARALLNDAYLIIADEPTGNLDPQTSHEILTLLQGLCSEKCAVLMATHNHYLIQQFPAEVMVCKQNTIQPISIENLKENYV